MLKKGASLRQGYGRQASGVLGPLSCSRTLPRAKVPAVLAERTPRLREGMLFEHPLSLFLVTKDVKDQFHFEKLQFFQKSL